MKTHQVVSISALSGVLATAVLGMAQGPMIQSHTRIATLTPVQQQILSHMSIVYLSDGQGGTVETIRVTGVNLQIVNGLGATNGYPANPDLVSGSVQTNGVGNLIVGYNELGNVFGDDRRGSHNIVVGHGNTYTSFGGLIASRDNTISAAYASVSGGTSGRASGTFAAINGGQFADASGSSSSVLGGYNGDATGAYATIAGGRDNDATGDYSSVSGGNINLASAAYAVVSGGNNNTASANVATVSGGANRSATGFYDWVGGGYWQDQ